MEFNRSDSLSLGMELEIQLVNDRDFDLEPRSVEFIENFGLTRFASQLVPEITQSMLELNSGVHKNPDALLFELKNIRHALNRTSHSLGVGLSGGGSHPFQMWNDRKIYPDVHYMKAKNRYGYLAKMFTVFGMHIHVGCQSGDEAVYLMNILARYVPQFIALTASSPFCQGVDTGYDSSRGNVVNMFPLSGLAPAVHTWEEFSNEIQSLKKLNIVQSLKNLYWDIRPKPEFGTVEIRVCDTPLTIEHAVSIVAYAQCLAKYILEERPFAIHAHDPLLYSWNRYHASYNSFQANFIDPYQTHKKTMLKNDMLETIEILKPYAAALGTSHHLERIKRRTLHEENDAKLLRDLFRSGMSLKEMMLLQTQMFSGEVSYADGIATRFYGRKRFADGQE